MSFPAGGPVRYARPIGVAKAREGRAWSRRRSSEAAELLCAARLRRARFAGLPDGLRPKGEAEAYAIQDALHVRLDAAGRGPLAGYKIGCTTPVMQRFLGIDNPCAGGVLAPGVQRGRASFATPIFFGSGSSARSPWRSRGICPRRARPTIGTRSAMPSAPAWRRSRWWTTVTRTIARSIP